MTAAIAAEPPPTHVASSDTTSPAGHSDRRSRLPGTILFAALATLYFAFGCVMVLRYNLFDPDAPSRVANAGYSFLSRHPHLSAIGFVWNPLPSIVEIPFVWLSQWWAPLKTYGLAGAAQSAIFMAGLVMMIRAIAFDRRVSRTWRWIAVAGFALNPLIVVYGGSGMSEAAQMFCLVWCARYLLQWVERNRIGDLGWAGVALGVCYLARYEAVPAACGAVLLVGIVAFVRAPTNRRWTTTVSALLIIGLPITVAVVVWAATGWIVADEFFAQFSSLYGNENQVTSSMARAGQSSHSVFANLPLIFAMLLAAQPFVLLACGFAGAVAFQHKRFDPLVPIAVLGPVLIFSIYGQYTSTTFGWFRYFITAVPLVVILALVCWRPGPEDIAKRRRRATTTLTRKASAALIAASTFIAGPLTFYATLDERIGNQQLQFGIKSLLSPSEFTQEELWFRRLNVNERAIADYFDRKQLPPGSVLMDTFNTWAIWLASDRPQQFVITSDYDFISALNRPYESDVQYIVVSNPDVTAADAVTLRYPTFWNDGADKAVYVMSIEGPTGEERFRVYKIVEPTPAEPSP